MAESATPGFRVKFIEFNPQRSAVHGGVMVGTILHDIDTHLPEMYGDYYWDYEDLEVAAHETTHGINSAIRKNLDFGPPPPNKNGFYVTGNRAIVLLEPHMVLSFVRGFVPQSLRGNQFAFYIENPSDWEDLPSNILDEWTAYVNGAAAVDELWTKGLYKKPHNNPIRRELTQNLVEFQIYAIAYALAIESAEPEYFKREPQFLEFLAYNLSRGAETYRSVAKEHYFVSPFSVDYLETFATSPDAQPLRSFLERHYGREWAESLIKGGITTPSTASPVAISHPESDTGPADKNPPPAPKFNATSNPNAIHAILTEANGQQYVWIMSASQIIKAGLYTKTGHDLCTKATIDNAFYCPIKGDYRNLSEVGVILWRNRFGYSEPMAVTLENQL
jgi:hypothetical protein